VSGPAGRLDAVLVCGGRWHDFDHARLELLCRLASHPQVRTRVFEDYSRPSALDTADLLVTYTCDVRPAPGPQQRALIDFVARGGRWLALHATNAAIDPPAPGGPRVFRTPPALGPVAEVLGSRFLGHPPIAPYRVEVTRPGHPLVAGIEPFEVTDELYVCELHGPLEVLLHARWRGPCPGFEETAGDGRAEARDGRAETVDGRTEAEGGDGLRPVLYLRPHGRGAVCYFTLGHCRGRYDVQDLGVDDLGREDRGSWPVPEFGTILDRCLAWAVTGSVTGSG
jgi:hypothetical protein